MAHLRIFLSTPAFNRLRGITGRTGRSAELEASLQLEAVLLGVALEPDAVPTLVGIQRLAAQANQAAGQKR